MARYTEQQFLRVDALKTLRDANKVSKDLERALYIRCRLHGLQRIHDDLFTAPHLEEERTLGHELQQLMRGFSTEEKLATYGEVYEED